MLHSDHEGVPDRCIVETTVSLPRLRWKPRRVVPADDWWSMKPDPTQSAEIQWDLDVAVISDDRGNRWLRLTTAGPGFSATSGSGHLSVDTGWERGCYQDLAELAITTADTLGFRDCAPKTVNETNGWSYDQTVKAELEIEDSAKIVAGVELSTEVSGTFQDFDIVAHSATNSVRWQFAMRQTDGWEAWTPQQYGEPDDLVAKFGASVSGHVYPPARLAASNVNPTCVALWKVRDPAASTLDRVPVTVEVRQRMAHVREETGHVLHVNDGIYWETSEYRNTLTFHLDLTTSDPTRVLVGNVHAGPGAIVNASNSTRVKT